MVQQTSLNAYYNVKESLGDRQLQVYDFLNSHQASYSNSEIAYALELPINRVTPRIYELRKKGYVKCDGKRYCRITGKEVLVWKALKV